MDFTWNFQSSFDNFFTNIGNYFEEVSQAASFAEFVSISVDATTDLFDTASDNDKDVTLATEVVDTIASSTAETIDAVANASSEESAVTNGVLGGVGAILDVVDIFTEEGTEADQTTDLFSMMVDNTVDIFDSMFNADDMMDSITGVIDSSVDAITDLVDFFDPSEATQMITNTVDTVVDEMTDIAGGVYDIVLASTAEMNPFAIMDSSLEVLDSSLAIASSITQAVVYNDPSIVLDEVSAEILAPDTTFMDMVHITVDETTDYIAEQNPEDTELLTVLNGIDTFSEGTTDMIDIMFSEDSVEAVIGEVVNAASDTLTATIDVYTDEGSELDEFTDFVDVVVDAATVDLTAIVNSESMLASSVLSINTTVNTLTDIVDFFDDSAETQQITSTIDTVMSESSDIILATNDLFASSDIVNLISSSYEIATSATTLAETVGLDSSSVLASSDLTAPVVTLDATMPII